MLLLSSQFSFKELKKKVFKVQNMFSRHPRIRNLNFSEFPELTRQRVKNDVYICPRGVKKEVYGIYIYASQGS